MPLAPGSRLGPRDGPDYLVMEWIGGSQPNGSMPIDQALKL